MPPEETDFDFTDLVSNIAVDHARKATPVEKAWPEIVAAAKPKLGAKLAKAALELPITASLVQVTATYFSLLGRDKPGKKIKGLYFGLLELTGDDVSDTMVTPYIAGADRFDPKDEEWPCDCSWSPEDRFAMNPAMFELSQLRHSDPDKLEYIDMTLIDPLNTLFTGAIANGVLSELILGPTKERGIGCGFDAGELRTLGVVTMDGFQPLS